MMHPTLLEFYAELRAAELEQQRVGRRPPARPPIGASLRQRLAQGLIGVGLRLDADASRAILGSFEAAPQRNSSDV